ncbi:MAG: TonB family protein [Desulfuromonadales bacterium]|nr:TonB family protein [Desulfuromonadales bacterium]
MEIGLVLLDGAKRQFAGDAGKAAVESGERAEQKPGATSDHPLDSVVPLAGNEETTPLPSIAAVTKEGTADVATFRSVSDRPASRMPVKTLDMQADRPTVKLQSEGDQQVPLSARSHQEIYRKTETGAFSPARNLNPGHEGQASASHKASGSTRVPPDPDVEGAKSVYPVRIPRYADNPAPHYPDVALRKGWEGLVLLRVDVQKNGLVRDVAVASSSGFALLDQAAVSAVSRWEFLPAMRSGLPVDGRAVIPISFVLP